MAYVGKRGVLVFPELLVAMPYHPAKATYSYSIILE
jgi:hypothetical protein